MVEHWVVQWAVLMVDQSAATMAAKMVEHLDAQRVASKVVYLVRKMVER